MIVRLTAVLLVLGALSAQAQDVARIVYLGVENDLAYEPKPSYTGLSLKDNRRPVAGARVAMRGTRILARALGLTFALEENFVPSNDDVPAAIESARQAGALAVLLDIPEEVFAKLPISNSDTILFNIRHREQRWREEECHADMLHTIPSHAMLSDALAQHLKFQGWENIMLLSGQDQNDAKQAEAVRHSIKKFGLNLKADRTFELSNDPRQRDLNNIVLVTSNTRYDVIWLIDNVGEFGRYVPYASYLARPIVGSEGLVAAAWHWTYERHGAPQLNQRFRRDGGHNMTSEDWAAWAAVRAVIESVSRTGSVDVAQVSQYLRSDALSLDLYKGVSGSFRQWSGQLRQPILLATHNAVIAHAPLDGFLHQSDTLDTLGLDLAEATCGLE